MTHPRPLLSFLTTAYGTEDCIGATIESVQAQQYSDWEMIIVDNGRVDEMAAAVAPYLADRRLTLLRQDNRGYLGGVATAAAAATGRYLCVLDSDDILDARFGDRVHQVIIDHPDVGAVAGGGCLFRDPDDGLAAEDYFTSVGRKNPPDPARPATFHDLLEHGVPIYTGAIRRDLWDSLGGYRTTETDVEPDVVLWLRLAAGGHQLRLLPDPLLRMRVRPLSESRHPAKIDAFDTRLQESFLRVGAELGVDTRVLCRGGMLRRLRYQQALRQARTALLADDTAASARAAAEAFRQQRTMRAALVLAGVHTAPRLMRDIHPVKLQATAGLRRALHRFTGR